MSACGGREAMAAADFRWLNSGRLETLPGACFCRGRSRHSLYTETSYSTPDNEREVRASLLAEEAHIISLSYTN